MTRHLFAPLQRRGVEIVHLDCRDGDGIDICADLLDAEGYARAAARRYRALLCCNILEHVRDPGEFAWRCVELVMPGGIIVVTVPRSYPRHGDPIDTLYRPTPEEAAALFPATSTRTLPRSSVSEMDGPAAARTFAATVWDRTTSRSVSRLSGCGRARPLELGFTMGRTSTSERAS